MQTDVAGRVRNTTLAVSKPLLPLYEAVVNSIQAIEQGEVKDGTINVSILRDKQHMLKDQDPELGDIVSFEITDNGIGFNEENLHAFETSDTTYKAKLGGKGIGRFLWLVAFEDVEVISHFKQNEKMFCRKFEFLSDGDGVRNMIVSDSEENTPSTTVRLRKFRKKHQQQCPKKLDTIATHLIEHCLEYFIRDDCPEIILVERSTGNTLSLNQLFEQAMAGQSKREKVSFDNHRFEVLHVRLHTAHVKDHQIHYCANSRIVKSEKILGNIPNIARRLQDQDGRDFVYAAYVDSPVLDESVNPERTDFNISDDDTGLIIKTITWKDIRNTILEACQNFLKPYTDPIRELKKKRIVDFVDNEGPMYRPILKHIEDKIDLIDPEIKDDALDIKLYQAYQALQVDLRIQGDQLLQKEINDTEWEGFSQQLQGYFDKVSDINKSDLARYVCHRKVVLDFLNKQLNLSDDGKYHREERIHQIIFPPRKTSEDISFDEHNLWLLDEKLVYHTFLASDKPLRTNSPIITDSRKEPDIIIYDKACAFATGNDLPFAAITIIEFKRPMRNDYKPEDNPFVQVRQYIDDIRDGKARTPNGRDIPITKEIPFYCYIVCDLTQTLEKQAYDFELTKTPDGQGFFGYKRQHNAYVEVFSYNKMVADAKKRNTAFFNKLGLPSRIGQ